MRVGIFGASDDQHCRSVALALGRRGAEVVLVCGSDLHEGEDFASDSESFFYRGQCLDDVGAWFVRKILSPLPPAFSADDEASLYADWLTDYMHRRERFGYLLSWLLAAQARGVPMANPPEQGVGMQLKLYQLAVARQLGLPTPRTLVTNNPERVRAFAQRVPDVVYKPSMGGDLCRPLDTHALDRLHTVKSHPVIFQERVTGTSVRVTVVGGEVVSAVAIPTAALDYRSDETYASGGQQYEAEVLPQSLAEQVTKWVAACGLSFAGVDLIRTAPGQYVFLEANASPNTIDIEEKTGADISDAIARHLLAACRSRPSATRRARPSFVPYASPFSPLQKDPA